MKYQQPAKNVILDKSFNFSLSVIELYKKLSENKEYVLSRQLLRSGTSIGANIEESTAAQSKKDFLSKISIASKEARETRYWLKRQLVQTDYQPYLREIDEIIRIITAIVKTTESKQADSIKN